MMGFADIRLPALLAGSLAAGTVLAAGADGESRSARFVTVGPDLYRDGSSVCEGELYLAVYIPKGSSFAGLDTRGKLLSSENSIVTTSRAIWNTRTEGYRCKSVTLSYKTSDYPDGGTFLLLLCDTRVNGAVTGTYIDSYTISQAATARKVSTYFVVGAISTGTTGGAFTSDMPGELSESCLDKTTDVPLIADFSAFADGSALLKLANVRNDAVYTVMEASSPVGEWKPVEGLDKVWNRNDAELPVPVAIPASVAKARFFKVIGK